MASVERPGGPTTIEAFFGDLIDEVALAAPVTRRRLVAALADVAAEVEADGSTTVQDDVAQVAAIPVAEWNHLARETGLRPEVELAVREVHRRMAASIGATDACTRPGADPCVVIEEYHTPGE